MKSPAKYPKTPPKIHALPGNNDASTVLLSPIAALLTIRNKGAALIFEAQHLRMDMGQEDIFTALVNEHYQALYRFALSLTRSESDASDLTQQTFLIWANKGHQLRDPAKAKFWLFRTLHRCFLLTRRNSGRFIHHELESVAEELPVLSPGVIDEIDAPTVLAALAKVGPPYQAAVALFYLEQWSYNKIAEALDISIGTVKSRISRGIAQLRGLLTDRLAPSPTGTLVAVPAGNRFGYENSYERHAPALMNRGARLELQTETELCHC